MSAPVSLKPFGLSAELVEVSNPPGLLRFTQTKPARIYLQCGFDKLSPNGHVVTYRVVRELLASRSGMR